MLVEPACRQADAPGRSESGDGGPLRRVARETSRFGALGCLVQVTRRFGHQIVAAGARRPTGQTPQVAVDMVGGTRLTVPIHRRVPSAISTAAVKRIQSSRRCPSSARPAGVKL